MLTNEMFKVLLVTFGVNIAASYTHTQRKGSRGMDAYGRDMP